MGSIYFLPRSFYVSSNFISIFILLFYSLLSIETDTNESNLIFEIIFVVVWGGACVISINSTLLGGKMSIFQGICLLGYCLFPLVICAVINLFLGHVLHVIIRLIYGGIAFLWCTYSSLHFVKELVPEDRKELAMYPIVLFYLFLSWFIVL